MVKLGFLGAGTIMQVRHLPEAEMNEKCKIAGYFNRTKARAEGLARIYGGRVYDSLEDLLNERGIDAVVNASPNFLHAPYTVKALEAGKHVLCEKPMATTLAECQAMIDAAKANNKKLMLAHNMRTEPAHQLAKDVLASGELGSVLSFNTTIGQHGPEQWSVEKSMDSWFYDRDAAVFGAIGDLAVHKIDLIRWLLDDEIAEVKAYIGTLIKKQKNGQAVPVDDFSACILRSSTGAVGTLTAAWTFSGEEDWGSIFQCSEGTLKIYADPESPVIVIKSNGDTTRYQPFERMVGDERHSRIVDMFVNTIEQDIEPPISGADGLASIKIVLACIESSRTGCAVKLSN